MEFGGGVTQSFVVGAYCGGEGEVGREVGGSELGAEADSDCVELFVVRAVAAMVGMTIAWGRFASLWRIAPFAATAPLKTLVVDTVARGLLPDGCGSVRTALFGGFIAHCGRLGQPLPDGRGSEAVRIRKRLGHAGREPESALYGSVENFQTVFDVMVSSGRRTVVGKFL